MEKKKTKLSIKKLGNKFIPTIKKIFGYLKRSDFNSKMKLIGEIIVLILVLCLLKLPFSIVRDMIINAFFSVKISSTILMNSIYLLFGLPYYILIIYLFVKTIVTRYEKLEVKEESKLNNINNTSSTPNSDNKDNTNNNTIEEEKEAANIPLQSMERTPNTNLENPISINNEQENNINNSLN